MLRIWYWITEQNIFIRISLILLSFTIIFLIIGLSAFSAKWAGAGPLQPYVNYYQSNANFTDVLHHTVKGAPTAWTAGTIFSGILTPIGAGLTLVAGSWGFYRKQKYNY